MVGRMERGIKMDTDIKTLYESWLLNNYGDEIHCEEELIQRAKTGFHWQEFKKWILKEIGEEKNNIKRIADSMEWIVKSLKKNKLYIGVLR
jgi:hypothetical protein